MHTLIHSGDDKYTDLHRTKPKEWERESVMIQSNPVSRCPWRLCSLHILQHCLMSFFFLYWALQRAKPTFGLFSTSFCSSTQSHRGYFSPFSSAVSLGMAAIVLWEIVLVGFWKYYSIIFKILPFLSWNIWNALDSTSCCHADIVQRCISIDTAEKAEAWCFLHIV